mmetsp:Transcript_30983/g.49753  ORF Transcript_30983/g.49753 Transcript_30983/m.49753 type:complete len:151 (-) Transcript_30983:33-485(-)
MRPVKKSQMKPPSKHETILNLHPSIYRSISKSNDEFVSSVFSDEFGGARSAEQPADFAERVEDAKSESVIDIDDDSNDEESNDEDDEADEEGQNKKQWKKLMGLKVNLDEEWNRNRKQYKKDEINRLMAENGTMGVSHLVLSLSNIKIHT